VITKAIRSTNRVVTEALSTHYIESYTHLVIIYIVNEVETQTLAADSPGLTRVFTHP